MTKQFKLSADSIQRLSGCHPDLVRVFARTAKITGVHVLRGAADPSESTSPTAADTHRPSDAAIAIPDGARPPQEPGSIAHLSTGEQKEVREWVRNLTRWYYLGGVVMGVAETLHDQKLLDRPVRWMGAENGGSGLSRFERGDP